LIKIWKNYKLEAMGSLLPRLRKFSFESAA